MKRMKLLILLAVLTVSTLLLSGFGRNDQTFSGRYGSPAASKTSDGKDSVKLKVDDAKKIAFEDAGVKETDVTLKKAGLAADDGIVRYEVEFYFKNYEYEYDIDPDSGRITDSDKEKMDSGDYTKMMLLKKKAAVRPSSENKVDKLTIKDAKKIAFDDAGVTEKEVILKKAILTTDDGADIFEVEFYCKDFEYEYDIDPKTGIITDLDREPMDAEDRAKMEALKKKASAKPSDKTGDITLDDAKKTALDDVGVKEADVVMKKAALSTDDGKKKYEIEFYCNDIGYEYDIDPKTGAITDLDRDPMDAEDRAEMKVLLEKAKKGTAGDAGGIDEDKAFDIAIAHAEISAADAYEKQVRLDYEEDLGREVYEVEFKAGDIEYSYDIDPSTGEILQYESERDD